MFRYKCCGLELQLPQITERRVASRSDFIHKLRVVLKELNETVIWLQMVSRGGLLPEQEIVAIVAENRELAKIIAASVRTARGGSKSQLNGDPVTDER